MDKDKFETYLRNIFESLTVRKCKNTNDSETITFIVEPPGSSQDANTGI